MYRLRINSEAIEFIEYNHNNRTLEIGYHNKAIHQYRNVPYIEYQRLVTSKNTQRHIEKYITNNYITTSKH